MRFMAACAASALLAIAAGCGEEDSAGSSGGPGAASAGSGDEVYTLPDPLLANCGVENFAKPNVSRKSFDGAPGFEVIYRYAPVPPAPAPEPGDTTVITIIERAPEYSAGSVQGESTTIAGRDVALQRPTGGETSRVAEWKTEEALYVALVGGTRSETLADVVRCMP